MSHEPVTSQAKRHLIACEVFRDEFEAVCPPEMARTYLEQGLHRTPGKMPEAIQGVVDGLPTDTRLVLLGYGLAAVSKFVFPLAPTLSWIIAARFADRVGKGIRGAPRDALIAASTRVNRTTNRLPIRKASP